MQIAPVKHCEGQNVSMSEISGKKTSPKTDLAEKPASEKPRKTHVEWHVLPKGYTGGPHGVGDPDDYTLREVETSILIENMVKEHVKRNYCQQVITEFENCARTNGLMMPFRCRPQRDHLKECLEKWLKNEDIRKLCTEQYLEKRRRYRLTGIGEPMKKKKSW